MRLAGFSAEESLYPSRQQYRASGWYTPAETSVVPQARWGNFMDDGCPRQGVRRFLAILWDLPWGGLRGRTFANRHRGALQASQPALQTAA